VDVYTLDALFRRQYTIDNYVSLIWTERFKAYGEFQLDIESTVASRTLLTPGALLAMSKSNYIMRVESIEDDIDNEGKKLLIVKGRSLESILLDRVAFLSLSDTTTIPKWTIADKPAAVARKVFHDICVTGTLNAADKIPFINEGTFLPASTISEPVDPITVDITPTSVYDVIVNICNTWNLGMRMLRNGDTSQLWFDIYAGSDRTTGQTMLTPVVFAPELDNLQNTKELTSIDKAKNVAYVFSPAGFQAVYPVGVDPTVGGFDRRVVAVIANDVTSSNPDVASALIQRGRDALANARVYQGFDGEISQSSQYQYGIDYRLGDIVEIRNTDGVANNMRVTEQIFVNDSQGERSYPTLTLNVFINTGSWLSWMNDKQWFDLDPSPTAWADQP
jgi:hypothetical protein